MTRRLLTASKKARKRSPATFCNPSDMSFMPNRKRPRPPRAWIIMVVKLTVLRAALCAVGNPMLTSLATLRPFLSPIPASVNP